MLAVRPVGIKADDLHFRQAHFIENITDIVSRICVHTVARAQQLALHFKVVVRHRAAVSEVNDAGHVSQSCIRECLVWVLA